MGTPMTLVRLQDWIDERSDSIIGNEDFLNCSLNLAWMITERLCQIEKLAKTTQPAKRRSSITAQTSTTSELPAISVEMGFFTNLTDEMMQSFHEQTRVKQEKKEEEEKVQCNELCMGFFSKMEAESERTDGNDSDCAGHGASADFQILKDAERGAFSQEDVGEDFDVLLSESCQDFSFDIPSIKIVRVKLFGGDNSPKSVINSRSACCALGRVLLELFSKGKSRSMTLAAGSQETASGLTRLNIQEKTVDTVLPPPGKRKSQGGGVSSQKPDSLKAKECILGCGLPISICRLVSDLLDAGNRSDLAPDSAITSLGQALSELTQMKEHPTHFLFDCTCPEQATKRMYLFRSIDQKLYGRDSELIILNGLVQKIADHDSSDKRDSGFLCEAAFLSGHSGSGKSSLMHNILHSCESNDWFVLSCKFDRKMSPIGTFAKAFDIFFVWLVTRTLTGNSNWDTSLNASVDQIAQSINQSIDSDDLLQLSKLIPNLIPLTSRNRGSGSFGGTFERIPSPQTNAANLPSTIMGSGRNRLYNIFRLLMKSICCGRRPVLLVLDDLQWADDLSLEVIANCVTPSVSSASAHSHQGGLLLLGSFRENEVSGDCSLMKQIKEMENAEGNINVKRLAIAELSQCDINHILSFNIGLPMRLTRSLAEIVHQKTRGNPLFVKEFLESLIASKIMTFSVKLRRWRWDEEIVDIKMISKSVAELITKKICHLPENVLTTLKIAACFGSQVEVSTMRILNSDETAFDMMGALEMAIKEGLMEKAGPIYAFSHDMVEQAIYNSIPIDSRKWLHKHIGSILIQKSLPCQAGIRALGIDQINLCKDNVVLSPEECSNFANINLAVGKHAMASFQYEEAQSYFKAAISLLQVNHWETQYSLSLELYEMLAAVCFISGDADDIQCRLHAILLHSKSFDDSINANAILTKVLWSSGKFTEAINTGLRVLADLGEVFPEEIQLTNVMDALSEARLSLMDIPADNMLSSPNMLSSASLNSMKFMSLLCNYAFSCKPMLLPFLSCRMIKMTLQSGFCDDSIIGFAMLAQGLVSFADDIEFGYRVGKIAQSLMAVSKNTHAIRSRLIPVLGGGVMLFVEPLQSVGQEMRDALKSCKLAGDVEGAMLCRWAYGIVSFYGGMNLCTFEKELLDFFRDLAKHTQALPCYGSMSMASACNTLSESKFLDIVNEIIDMKSHDELVVIAEQMKSPHLTLHVQFYEVCIAFWRRDFNAVVDLTEEHKLDRIKRPLQIFCVFYVGIAALNVARDSNDSKLKIIGKRSIERMVYWTNHSRWNFENKLLLLRAELHYLEDEQELAVAAYESAIKSAHDHRFVHEEGLSYELYGHFCLTNSSTTKALQQFSLAREKYLQWGATKKVHEMEEMNERLQNIADNEDLAEYIMNM